MRRKENLGYKLYNAVIFLLLALYCASLLLVLIWMVCSSFKSEIDYTLNTFGLPEKWVFANYRDIMKFLNVKVYTNKGLVQYGIWDMAANSVLRSAGQSFMMVFVTACVAYVMAKYKFVGNRFIYALGIFVMITPIVGNLPNAMLVRKALGIYDNMALYILTSPSVIFGLHFLLLYGAFKGIPYTYAEAAFIDGAGHFKVMFGIMLPMMLPTCAALFTLDFLNSWNDYMTPMIWLPSYPNLAYGMYRFQYDATSGSEGATTPMILAGFTVIMIPTVLLYLSMQKLIMSKFTIGGIKG